MPTYKTGPFGRRLPTPPPDDVTVQEIFPPSREERMQTRWMYGTIVIGVLILGLGLLMRYTVFAKKFEPPRFTSPVTIDSSPTPTPTPAPTATPAPVVTEATPTPAPQPPMTVPSLSAPNEKTGDGEPVTPSLAETGGRPVPPR